MHRLTMVTLNKITLWHEHSALRQKCHEVNVENPVELLEAQNTIREMFITLYNDPSSVALAAPQVGILKQIVVISFEDRESSASHILALINPTIVAGSEETDDAKEICLSVPNFTGIARRHSTIKVQAFDQHGKSLILDASGFFARVLQHEIDHINGVLYIDKLHGELEEIPDYPERRTKSTVRQLGLK